MASDPKPVSTLRSASLAGLVRERAWALAVWAAMLGWTIVLCAIIRDGYVNFRSGRFDLGNMVQAVWSTANGRPLEITHGATGEQMVRLGGHVDPFLALLAPVWIVWPSPLALAFAQIAVVSVGALPVLWLGRRHLGSERAAGLLALAYLAYPWLAWSAVAAIHPVTFAIPLFLFCVWFLDTDRLIPFALSAALAVMTGELMGLPIVALGVWYALARRRQLVGIAIVLGGAAWTFLALYVIVPASSGESSIFYGFYDEVGGSPQGVVRKLFTDPGAIFGALFESHDLVYLVWLGVPLAGLFLLAPGLAAVALPQLLANGLSDFRSMTDPRYHSVAAVIPFLIAATVLGIARLGVPRRTFAAAAVLVSSAALTLIVGPWARVVGVAPLGARPALPAPRVAALGDAVALVPEGVPISASNAAGSHLSARRYVYSVPNLGKAEWVVVDLRDPWVVSPDSPILTNHPEVVRAFAGRLAQDPAWVKVFEREGVLVFRARANS
ncbi:MAG: putative rane protein [Thermoleophilia bacterium]|nr:putative rane protein [Thermoleophilia bacterium]